MAAIWDFLSHRFELFFIYKSPRCFLPSFESIGLSVQKKKGKTDFQDGYHLGYLTGTILAIFISSSHPDASYQFSNQLTLWFRKISEKKKGFKMAAMAAILDFRSKQFKLFYIYESPQCFLPSFESNGLSVQEKRTRGPRATVRSPEWHSHCRHADVMQHFSNPIIATNENIIIWAVLSFEEEYMGLTVNVAWSLE